jgi:arginine repressor
MKTMKDKKLLEQSEKEKRQKVILELIQSRKYRKQTEIVDELVKRKFTAVQGTVSRDINEMNIIKGDDGSYCITDETLHDMHRKELERLLKESPSSYYQNVAFHYMKVEKGKASIFAFHLQQAFPDILLDITIGMDNILLLINKDNETDEFRDLIKTKHV